MPAITEQELRKAIERSTTLHIVETEGALRAYLAKRGVDVDGLDALIALNERREILPDLEWFRHDETYLSKSRGWAVWLGSDNTYVAMLHGKLSISRSGFTSEAAAIRWVNNQGQYLQEADSKWN